MLENGTQLLGQRSSRDGEREFAMTLDGLVRKLRHVLVQALRECCCIREGVDLSGGWGVERHVAWIGWRSGREEGWDSMKKEGKK